MNEAHVFLGLTDSTELNPRSARFNARELFNNLNIFRGLTHNPIFFAIVFITVSLQVRTHACAHAVYRDPNPSKQAKSPRVSFPTTSVNLPGSW